jgi:alkanesulfonate monooxygenase
MFRIFTEPQQGASYDQLLAVARTAEAAGYGAFFRSDHVLKMGDVSGLPGVTDAWVWPATPRRSGSGPWSHQ